MKNKGYFRIEKHTARYQKITARSLNKVSVSTFLDKIFGTK